MAGGKQLDTAISGRADDIKARESERHGPASADGLCESISKIIHSATATHFCLPGPIRVLRAEDDRKGTRAAAGRFCLIYHQHPGDPPRRSLAQNTFAIQKPTSSVTQRSLHTLRPGQRFYFSCDSLSQLGEEQ